MPLFRARVPFAEARASSLREELAPFAESFRISAESMASMEERFKNGLARAANQAVRRFTASDARFRAASNKIPSLVDNVILRCGDGKMIDEEWKKLLKDSGCSDAMEWFARAAKNDFERELSEEANTAGIDFQMSGASDLDDLLNQYKRSKSGSTWKKLARAAMRTADGSGAGGLITWEVNNFGNPTGWLAGGCAVFLVAGAEVAGERIVCGGTDKWARATDRDLEAKRARIVAQLRSRFWQDQRAARAVRQKARWSQSHMTDIDVAWDDENVP